MMNGEIKQWGSIPEWDSPHDSRQHCDHPTLKIIVRGQNEYLCKECDWVFQIFGAIKKPWSWTPAEILFKAAAFIKAKGIEAFEEGANRPFPRRDLELIDGRQQRESALPEGVTREQMQGLYRMLEAFGQLDPGELQGLPKETYVESEDARLPEGDSQQVSG